MPFDAACADAATELAAFADAPEGDDDRVYHLIDSASVIGRAHAMLDHARTFAILSVTPALIETLVEPLHRATRRGIAVACKVFEACERLAAETSIEMIIDPRGPHALENAPGDWLILSVDGRASLQALFHADSPRKRTPLLHLATYTTNPLLAWSQYSGLSSDLLLASVRRRIANGADAATIGRELDRLARFESSASAGKLALVRRFRSSPRRAGPR
ncbi:MAG: hypothetical protein JNL80_15545 [Phycisphaerae bacterium]|nr:hypothetical protein [Phycisphaerae bacterium]